MNKLTKFGLVMGALISVSSVAVAAKKADIAIDVTNDYSITAADVAASPELNESTVFAKSSSVSMKCLVDTPKWDRWGSPRCFSGSTSFYATAYFSIDNLPSNYTVYWSDTSNCSSNAGSCSVRIRSGQTITMSATVLDHSNNTFSTTTAYASYENLSF